MAEFMQIIEFETTQIEEWLSQLKQMQAEQGDRILARQAWIAEDRDKPGHYVAIIQFDSYEDAMKNSADPVLSELNMARAKLMSGPPTFHNLDVRQTNVYRETVLLAGVLSGEGLG